MKKNARMLFAKWLKQIPVSAVWLRAQTLLANVNMSRSDSHSR